MKEKPLPNKYLIVVAGPTAVGKTDLCIQLAQHLQTEIISADARQCYYGMPIGTAQPTLEQQQTVKHHFINCWPIQQPYSAGKFEKDALALINHLFDRYSYLIVTGGSGLYIQALCEGLDTMPQPPSSIRDYWNQKYQEAGIQYLLKELALQDPVYYQLVDKNNPHRLIRALEICTTTGKPYSQFRLQNPPATRPFHIISLGLTLDRSVLYQRINQRVEQMMAQGLLEEATGLYPDRHSQALQTVGYQEIFDYLEKKHTLAEATALIQRNTRRYAKRQLTWFTRQMPYMPWFSPQQFTDILTYLQGKLFTND
eukprot:gene1045-1326_t